MTVRPKHISNLWTLVPMVGVVVAIAALYLGREVLIPFALALLLAFVLTPPVTVLKKLKLGRVASVLIVLTLAFSIAGGVLWIGTTQLSDIVSRLPEYQENIRRKIEAMRNPASSGLAKAAASINQISAELSPTNIPAQDSNKLSSTTTAGRRLRNGPEARGPVMVEVVKQQPGIFDSLGIIGASFAHFIAVAGAVVILTLFMLMQRGDLRNRLIQLFGQGHLNVMTTALDDAAFRVSRYLLTQSLVNGSFGLLLGLGLYWIGVPNAPFWGVSGAILRFIPYIGTLIAGICPLLLAVAVFDGWIRPMLTLGLFATIELAMSAAIEPWLYGAHTGISSLAILVSAAFWTLLWGPIGLVLSTPLTVCLLVLGRYVAPLKFLTVLLGDQPVLPPEARYYQRLLAMDQDDAEEVAETYLRDKTLIQLYDSVLIPALSLAERDRHDNALDEEREKFIFQSTRDLIEELNERSSPMAELANSSDSQLSILCVPARDEADALVGLMLAQVLRQSGHQAQAIGIGSVEDMLTQITKQKTDLLFVSALPPFAVSQARSFCRRARQRCPGIKIILGFWDSAGDVEKIRQRLGSECFDHLITTLPQAESQVRLSYSSIELERARTD